MSNETKPNIDAIKECIQYPDKDVLRQSDVDIAMKQLDALVEENEQLHAQLNAAITSQCNHLEEIATLEKERDDWKEASKLWEADARGDAFGHNSILRKEIEQQLKDANMKIGVHEANAVACCDGVSECDKIYQAERLILEEYTKFLCECNYTDDDVWCEKPTSIDRFIAERGSGEK